MFCTNCGQQLEEGSKFCTSCGKPVAAASAGEAEEIAAAQVDAETAAAQTDAENAAGTPHMLPPGANMDDVANAAGQAASRAANAAGRAANAAGKAFGQAAERVSAEAQEAGIQDKIAGMGLNPKMLGIAAAAVVAVIAIIVVLAGRKPTVNLDKYATITFSGYDSLGKASLEFDEDKFNKDYGKLFEVSSKQVEKAIGDNETMDELVSWIGGADSIAEFINAMEPAELMLEDFRGSVDPYDNLSNGDTVTYTWAASEEEIAAYEELFSCKLKMEDITATVEGLEEIATFDAFEGVEITYSGIAPEGRVESVSNGSDEACADLYYSYEPDYGLSNGDTVTVTIDNYYNSNWEAAMAEQYGKVPEATTKEFVVEGLASYITSASDIPEEALSQMQSQAEDVLNAQIATDWESATQTLDQMEYIGNYFLSSKANTNNYKRNQIYLIYKVRAHNAITNDKGDSYDGMTDLYWYCGFTNLVLTEEGECSVDLTDYDTPRSDYVRFEVESGVQSGWWDKTWVYYGYQKLDMMYNQLVTTQIATYTGENNVEDVDYGDTGVASTDDDKDADDDGQILPNSSETALTEEDVEDLSQDDLQTAINEIYARHGYEFSDETILAHFQEYDWYEPTKGAGEFSESVFSQLEKDNIALMREHIK